MSTVPGLLPALMTYRDEVRSRAEAFAKDEAERRKDFERSLRGIREAAEAHVSSLLPKRTPLRHGLPVYDYNVEEFDTQLTAEIFRLARAVFAVGSQSAIPEELPDAMVGLEGYEFWQALEDAFGGSRAVDEAHRVAIATLDKEFELTVSSSRLKQLVSGLVLSQSVHTQKAFGSYRDYDCVRAIRVGEALSALGAWAREEYPEEQFHFEPLDLVTAIRLCARMWEHGNITFGARFTLVCDGHIPLIEAVTRKSVLDFKLHPVIAERLSVFLGIHRTADAC